MSDGARQDLSFTILTLNLHKGFSFLNRRFVLHELREAVRSVSADVVCLQEVLGSHEHHPLRVANWPSTPQYEFLADTIWQDFAYGRNAIYPEGHHGNAVLSKYPIVRYQNRDVSIRGSENRGLLHCLLERPELGREIHVICVHLGLREAHRRQQVDLLCRMIDDEVPPDSPLFIAGDFNDWRVAADARLRRYAGLREVFVETHGRAAKTFPARLPLLRLDRIYYRNAEVRKARVLSSRPWSRLSDHAALAVDVSLNLP